LEGALSPARDSLATTTLKSGSFGIYYTTPLQSLFCWLCADDRAD
jgi:hypothetical protein